MVKKKSIFRCKKIKVIWLILFITLWELSSRLEWVNTLLLPAFSKVFLRMIKGMIDGTLALQLIQSLGMILLGLGIGLLFAICMVYLDYFYPLFSSLFELLAAIFHPLPGMALLPIIMIWFGVGLESVLVVIVHAVVWSLYLSLKRGMHGVDQSLIEAAYNNGANNRQLFVHVLFPCAKDTFITGMQIGWSRGWRSLISAEMVFGAISALGGMGWFMYERRSFMDTTGMYAGILLVIFLGVIVEEVIFTHLLARWYKS